MTVVQFPKAPEPGWRPSELKRVTGACAAAIAGGEASGWEVGQTESGDPQIYLFGPPPDYDCMLCISRLGRRYVIEDGSGRVLFEHDDPSLLAEQAMAALRRHKTAIVARIAIAWCAIREAVEEKAEALTAEPMEILAHVSPQLVAMI